MKEMVGGCCVCSDDRGWAENPLVYCDGQGCNVAVHQACYGIVTVPTGNWYCRKCESQERTVKVRCELCPSRDGALKPTDNNGWAHVVCALYIPEVRFGNVTTMEPIILHQIPQERFAKSCYICEESSKGGRATVGACMQCNKVGCRQQFHVTCAQSLGLLCEEAGNYMDNVKYCGYCHHHYTKLVRKKGGNVKPIPPYRPVSNDSPDASPSKEHDNLKTTSSKRKLRGGKTPPTAQASPDPSSSPRPLTPGAKLSSSSSSSSSSTSSSSSLLAGATPGGAGAPPQLVGLHQGSTGSGAPVPPPPSSQPLSSAPTLVSGPQPPPLHPSVTNPSPPGTVVKPGSIVVQVPLEAAMGGNSGSSSGGSGAGTTGGSGANTPGPLQPPPPPPPPATSSPPVVPNSIEQPDIPAKRARSQSSEKSEKSRRSKRTSGASSSSNTSSSAAAAPPPSGASGGGTTGGNNSGSGGGSSGSIAQGGGGMKSVVPQVSPSPTVLPAAVVHPTPVVHHHQPSSSNINSTIKGMNLSESMNEVTMTSSSGSTTHRSRKTVVKEEKDIKIFQNGVSTTAPHMLGNQLNPSSTMAQKMCDTLSQEVAAHSIFSTEPNLSSSSNLVGPHLPKPSSSRAGSGSGGGGGSGGSSGAAGGVTNSSSGHNNPPGSSSNGGVTWNNNSIPQSLDQLLERQWEQGSQFLMEQAQHFDIASLLSCLHQLRAENAQLEEHVNSLLARRDHLLAVNARLAIPLVAPTNNTGSAASSGRHQNSTTGGGSGSTPATATVAPHVVENGLATPAEQQQYLHRNNPSAQNPQPVRSSQSQQGHNSGSGGGGSSGQSSVVVRATSSGGASSSGSSAITQPAAVTSSSVVVPPQQPPDQHRRL